MQRPLLNALVLFPAMLMVLALGSCGGDDDAGSPFDNNAGSDQTATTGAGGSGGSSNENGGGNSGEPSLTADPGRAWAEVEGQRVEYVSAGSIYYFCDIGTSQVNVNYQTPEGHDMSLNATFDGNHWVGSLTVKPGTGKNLQYSAVLPDDADKFVVGETSLSFEGTTSRLENFDLNSARDETMTLAVNCGAAGGSDAMADIGGTTYSFPVSGAQSFDCNVAADNVEVQINRLAIDNLQLEIDARKDGDRWLGSVTVYTAGGSLTSSVPADGEGLVIDGSSVTYEGTFGDVEGSVSVTCP